MPVYAPAATALGDDDTPARLIEVRKQHVVIYVVNERAGRDGDDQVLAALPVHFLSHARFTALRLPMVPAHEIKEGVFVGIGDEDDVAAGASVAAVGSALGDVLLAAKRDAP